MSDSILLVGSGKMGGALLDGWLKSGYSADKITIIDPAFSGSKDNTKVSFFDDISNLPDNFKPDIILFAVKPQILDKIVGDYLRFKSEDCIFLSIAAGKSIAFFKNLLGDDAAIIRAMPNLPALVGNGITVLIADKSVNSIQKDSCSKLLSAIGSIEWIEDENLMDLVTAVSGSGPAYLFYFMECFVDAAVNAGLERNLALSLVNQTIVGSAGLAVNSDKTLKDLRYQVTSPGGTTEAALEVFFNDDIFANIIKKSVEAAKTRSSELGNN